MIEKGTSALEVEAREDRVILLFCLLAAAGGVLWLGVELLVRGG